MFDLILDSVEDFHTVEERRLHRIFCGLNYDETFFDENTLLLVYVGANSGTYRFGVSSVFCAENSFCIHIEQTNNPEVVTDDMAGWFITVAVPDSMVENCTEFDADLNNDSH